MTRRTFQVAAILVAVALVGAAGLTVIATSSGSADQESGFLRHLHELGHRLHHGGNHHGQMAELIEQLELTPDQRRRLEKIHETMASHGGMEPKAVVELHERLVGQFQQGHVETDEVRQLIDQHVEQIRDMAYAVTDELIALVNGLDDRQREILLAHLQENHGKHGSH